MLKYILEKKFLVSWLTLVVCLLGILTYFKMPVELLPESDLSRIAVVLPNPGIDSRSFVTYLEDTIIEAAQRSNIKYSPKIEVNSKRIIFDFKSEKTSIDKISIFKKNIQSELKIKDIHLPFEVFDIGTHQSPVMTIMIFKKELKKFPNLVNLVKEKIEKIPGVSRVEEKNDTQNQKEFYLSPEPQSIEGFVNHVHAASYLKNLAKPGVVFEGNYNTTIKNDIDEKNILPSTALKYFKVPNNIKIENDYYNGEEIKILNIFRFKEENDLEVSNNVLDWLSKFRLTHPNNNISVIWDVAKFIRAADDNVISNLRDGIILTCICVFLFVRHFGQTLIISISIPISILIVFPFLTLFGVSRNVMSLAGIALAVGIVVDTSLSVVKDYVEYRINGATSQFAALRAARANLKPILLTSLSSLAVFIPILFLDGMVGSLFYDLSITFIIAQITSLIVSIFIIPIFSASFLDSFHRNEGEGKSIVKNEEPKYIKTCRWILNSNIRASMLSGLFLFLVFLSLINIPNAEFLPLPRENAFHLSVLTGDNIDINDKVNFVRKIEDVLVSRKAEKRKISWTEQGLEADFRLPENPDIVELNSEFRIKLNPYSVKVARFSPFDRASTEGRNIEFYINISDESKTRVKNYIQSLTGVLDQKWSNDVKSLVYKIDETRPMLGLKYGIPSSMLKDYWPFVNGTVVFGQSKSSQSVFVLKNNLSNFYANKFGSNFVSNEYLNSSLSNERLTSRAFEVNGKKREKVELFTLPGYSTVVHKNLKKYFNQNKIDMAWSDETTENQNGIQMLYYCLIVAVLLIFIILYFQQRSVLMTIVVLFTFLWAPVGAIPGLWIHREFLNGSALVGFILLAGSVVNNGILIVEAIQRYRVQQVSPIDSCLNGIRDRSLNVIITSLTTVFGMLPLVFETGVGSEMYRGLAIVVVYGVLVSTPISLIGVPCLVIVFSEFKEFCQLRFLRFHLRRELKGAKL